MSVQAGIWNFDGRPIDRKAIDDVADFLKPLGPDGESRYVNDSVALLYRPFHTTAESRRERQPYISRRGFVIAWDGRLDNREWLTAELRSELQPNPTDVSIFAAAFDRWDTDSFRHITGDWAVSVWKADRRELLLASDFMAVRHIFYYLQRDQIWWSADLGSLVLLSGDKFRIDDDYIAGYLAHNPDGHRTPYVEIRQVPAGHFVRVRNESCVTERFWRFSPESRLRYKTDAEYEDHFRHVFRQSVRRRLRSDSPMLAELSGGLDSSSIVCMAQDILSNEGAPAPNLETISYYDKTEPRGDDWGYFQKVEAKRGRAGIHIDGSKVGTSPETLAYRAFCSLPGALGYGQKVDTERTDAVRNGGYRAVLSGLGGDEFTGGVPDPRALLGDLLVQGKWIELARQLTAWGLVKQRPWIQLLWQAAVNAVPSTIGKHFLREAKVEPWFRKDFAERTNLAFRQIDVNEHFGLWLPTRRAYIGGVLTMANNMAKLPSSSDALEEARYPFLDQDFIEFILSIPASQLLRPGERRSLMRRALVGIVPQEILARRTKQVGQRTPMLILDRFWDELQSTYHASLSSHLKYVLDAQVLKAINDIRAGKSTALVRLLWTISLEYWLRDLAARGLLAAMPAPVLPITQELPVSA
jgi:asparagine synthase (glutamine-hydrolysing)